MTEMREIKAIGFGGIAIGFGAFALEHLLNYVNAKSIILAEKLIDNPQMTEELYSTIDKTVGSFYSGDLAHGFACSVLAGGFGVACLYEIFNKE